MEKKTLVIGASVNPQRYSFIAVNKLRSNNHPVVAIGRKMAKVGDVAIDIEKKDYTDIDTVTLYLNPVNQREYYDYILSLHPKRIIFNPGAENKEFSDLAKIKNITTLNACTLVLLSTHQF